MVDGYIPFAEAQASQATMLERAISHVPAQILEAQARGALAGPGPIFVGIGASYAASASAVWALRSRGINSWRLNAGDHPLPYPASDHPIIGVSQSGKSTETLAVLRTIDASLRLALVNVSPSPITGLVASTITLGGLPDSYASTVGYTATIVGLGMIAEAWDGGRIDGGWSALPDVFRALEEHMHARANALAVRIATASSADYAGAGPSAGSAEVGSLLLREVARVPASGFATRQYLHGAMESAGKTAHILLGDEREAAVAHTLARAGHDTILVTTLDMAEAPHLSVVRIPALPPSQRSVLEALVMQMLAVEAAKLKGLDPDSFVFHHNDTKVA